MIRVDGRQDSYQENREMIKVEGQPELSLLWKHGALIRVVDRRLFGFTVDKHRQCPARFGFYPQVVVNGQA